MFEIICVSLKSYGIFFNRLWFFSIFFPLLQYSESILEDYSLLFRRFFRELFWNYQKWIEVLFFWNVQETTLNLFHSCDLNQHVQVLFLSLSYQGSRDFGFIFYVWLIKLYRSMVEVCVWRMAYLYAVSFDITPTE